MNTPEEPFLSSEEDQIYNSPEKWHVRTKWVHYASRRKEKSRKNYINLLTLTSTKCYDIKLFQQEGLLLTTDTGYAPESVTFCECNSERYVLIRNNLPGAQDFGGKIEDFVAAGSAHLTPRAQRWFPYDVVNLDFTKPGFRQKEERTSITMQTISKIFTIQRLKSHSFTLFVTLPAIEQGNDVTGKTELANCLNSNLDGSYPNFEKNLLQKYPDKVFPDYREFLLVIVPKLIIKYGQSENFDTKCLERCSYINEGAITVMVTLIFDCEFIGLQAGYGSKNPAEILAELYQPRILEILEHDFEDINARFAEEPELRQYYLKIREMFA
jgi:hypothetical protein